jgi:hypothetical protein
MAEPEAFLPSRTKFEPVGYFDRMHRIYRIRNLRNQHPGPIPSIAGKILFIPSILSKNVTETEIVLLGLGRGSV